MHHPLTAGEVLDAVALRQACDGLPVEARHLEAQLDLRARCSSRWRCVLGGILRELERGGLVERQVGTERRHRGSDGRQLRVEHRPGGWVLGRRYERRAA